MRRSIVGNERTTLEEMLDDPIVCLVMARDEVTRADVELLFSNLRAMRRDDGAIYRLSVASRNVERGPTAVRNWYGGAA
jgi:hypothetical protein